jgi:hypothetical protein
MVDMSTLVIRHGISEANNRDNIGKPAFGHKDAELMPLGRQQARAVPGKLLAHYGIASSGIIVATSTLRRTQQTASDAGFPTARQRQYEQLDEIEHGINGLELRAMLDAGILPEVALTGAQLTLESTPSQKIWFTHGLRIAGLCAILGVYQEEPLIPYFGEIRELPI